MGADTGGVGSEEGEWGLEGVGWRGGGLKESLPVDLTDFVKEAATTWTYSIKHIQQLLQTT